MSVKVKDFYYFPGMQTLILQVKNLLINSPDPNISNNLCYASVVGLDGKIKDKNILIDHRFFKPLHTSDESEAIQKMKDMHFNCVGMDFGHSRCSKQCMTCYFTM